jgi:eukaryotic-like serine/threonine-protein kinase
MRDSLTSLNINPGDLLAGKYRVEKVLGVGGMGVVVMATHLELDERVALKFLLPEAVESPEAAARFVREARAAVKIKSEHVARVIDVGRLENGAPYMVMEFLNGTDLGEVVQQGQLPVEDAVDYLIQACDAMVEAHAAGIVHRDLKPSNLFLSRRNDGSALVKVLDFGISKVAVPDISEASLTRTSTLMGSPYYMSPEQMRSARNVDHRTDVWSMGVILYELLAGRPPFSGESLPDLLAAIMTVPPHPLRALRPELPAALEQVILRSLEKDVTRRFQSVGELAAALVPFAPRRSRHISERIFRISGISSPLPTSLPPQPLLQDPTLRSAERNEGAATTDYGPAGAALTNPAWSGTNRGHSSAGKALALGAGLGFGFLMMAGVAAFLFMKRGELAAEVPTAAAPPVVAAALPVPPAVSAVLPAAAPAPTASAAPPVPTLSASVATPPTPVAAAPAPASRPATKPAARPKAEVKAAAPPAPAPAPKAKNPLAIDLK